MASRLYNSLDDVPLCMRNIHAVQVRYSDNYTDVPLCLPNLTPSFQDIYKQRPFHNILENTLQCYITGLIVRLHSFLLTMA